MLSICILDTFACTSFPSCIGSGLISDARAFQICILFYLWIWCCELSYMFAH